jgi:methionyl-tRNA synthetase
LGNLLNRSLGMAVKYCQQTVPVYCPSDLSGLIEPLIQLAASLGDRVASAYVGLDFCKVCEDILSLVWACNKLIDDAAPWKLYKAGNQAEVDALIYTLLEAIRTTAFLISPITPSLSKEVYRQLGLEFEESQLPAWDHSKWGILESGTPLLKPTPVFVRIELAPIN